MQAQVCRPPLAEFIVTKEYKRFAEFCDACRRERYIGLCYGAAGAGKTLSARHYARWDLLEHRLPRNRPYLPLPPEIAGCRTLLYTPEVLNTPRQIKQEIPEMQLMLNRFVEEVTHQRGEPVSFGLPPNRLELLIVDEADRLKLSTLEQLRDLYDRNQLGLVLIGMPGLEKRLSRYPQFYSRVGFLHTFRLLSPTEMQFVLQQHWQELGLAFKPDDFTDAEAISAIIRITGGNFRLLNRLLKQIARILQVNGLTFMTAEVVEAARECLVIGTR
ncbi:MAG: AAA family ATPase [Leptolyngbya sp.]|nr:AAA family ATPase [Candidatus Melainabacteria bacterium]